MHVKGFGAFPAHVASEDAVGGYVVSLDWSGRLRVKHCNQGHADGNSLLDVEEDCTGLRLGSGCHDSADCLALGEYRAVLGRSRPGGWRGGSIDQIVMNRSTTACFGLNEVRCITINVETHVASVKTDDGVWLYCSVVHQSKIAWSRFVERDKHGGIDGSGYVEEREGDALHA